MKYIQSAFVISMLLNNSAAVSLGKADSGVPVLVNPVLMPNTMANETLGLNMTVGGDQVQVLRQKQKNASLAQGVPVLVNPVLMTDTMHDAKLDMKIVVGPDEIELKKKQQQHLAQGSGVPVYVNPVKMPNEMESASMDLKNMKVGGNTVSAAQKQGVPVLVNPVLMTDTMHDAKLDMKIVVGPDEIELKKKQQQHLAQGSGVPVYVNPVKMPNEMESASMDLKNMKVGGNTVSAAQKQGVPVLVNPVLMTDTMHDAKLDMKIVVGPDEIELKKKKMQQLVQQISSNTKYSKMTEPELEEIMNKHMLAGVNKAATPEDAKKNVDDMKNVEEALGKRILDRLNGYGWTYGYPLYPYIPYGSPYYYDVARYVNSIYAYEDFVNRYETANAIAGAAAPGIYDALKNALNPPPADAKAGDAKAANATVPAAPATPPKAKLVQFDDDVVLQLNGAPVHVNPESMIIENQMAGANLGLEIRMGPDDVSFKKKEKRLEDQVVLQVNGVPVHVNPESMIVGNTEAATNLGLTNMEIGPDEVSVAQKKAVKDIDDKEMKDSITEFSSKLVELKKRFKI